MQQEVVNIVLYRLEQTMDGFEDRQKTVMHTIEKGLVDKFKRQEETMSTNVTALETYIEEVHKQQIDDNEKLKKLATDAALLSVPAHMPSESVPEKAKTIGVMKAEQDIHMQCNKDYLTLCRE